MIEKILLLICFVISIMTPYYSQTEIFTAQVSQSSDDAEESEDTSQVLLESSDLELVFDDFSDQNNQTVGIRFSEVTIPSTAIIQNAYIQFYADDTGDIDTDVTIYGEAAALSQTFLDTPGNISRRTKTNSSVNWSIPEWSDAHEGGLDERSPDISILVEEIIKNNGWLSGNAMTFIVTGTGSREAESFDGIPQEAPILVVEYTLPQVDHDLGIEELNGLNDYMIAQNDVVISTVVKNYGLSEIDSFELSYSLNNATIGTEVIYQTLAPNESYNHTFNETLDLIDLGDQTVEAHVSTILDSVDFNNSLEVDFEVIEEYSDIYFGSGSAWRYLDDGSNLGQEWIELDYDDTTWALGAEEFGFGDGDENTLLESGNITYYFRKIVEVTDINAITSIVANISSDDAIVIYVNGQEVTRSFNLPQGPITATTTPDSSVPHDFENHAVKYDIPLSFFNSGLNVIAIELHNRSSSNVDLSFNCAFTNETINYSVDGPYVFHRNNEIIVKNITEDGPSITSYPEGTTPTLTCDLPNGDSFSFQLMEEIIIPESEYEMPEKFLVTTDIEGQIDAYILLLQQSGVIDDNYNWTYGDGHLFFIGDMFDRGEYVTQCLWLLYKLEQEAQLAGGQVHFIIGNHEVLNFVYDYRYVRDKYFENAHYLREMLYNLYEPDTEMGRWLRSKNILENAGNSAILVHAGLSPEVRDLNLTYDEINDYGRLGMDDNCPSGNTPCEIVNGGSDEGVYWYRGIAREELSQTEVDDIISSFNGEKMIFGHTVFPEVSSIYDQSVIVADVNHSNNFNNGFMEALYFESGCYYRLVANSNGVMQTQIDPDCITTSTTEVISTYKFELTPNLFEDEIMIHVSNDEFDKTLSVHNIYGDLIEVINIDAHENKFSINTAEWTAGAYIFSLQKGSQIVSLKAIKY